VQWLGNIPRMEGIRDSLRLQHLHFDSSTQPGTPSGEAIPLGARVLKLVGDLTDLLATGEPLSRAAETLGMRRGVYDPKLLQALAWVLADVDGHRIDTVDLKKAVPGMVVAEDFRGRGGALLIGRGFELTQATLDRLSRMDRGSLPETIRVATRGIRTRG
jgi:hypothetical protein